MFKKLSNWWNRDKIRLQELEDRITAIAAKATAAKKEAEASVMALEEHIADLTEQQIATESERAQLEADAEAARVAADHANSVEPWVEIKSDRIDPIKGLVIELDWNDAFIQYLKENGITGRDPETAVQKWVAMLYQNLMGDLEEIAIERAEEHTTGEFE